MTLFREYVIGCLNTFFGVYRGEKSDIRDDFVRGLDIYKITPAERVDDFQIFRLLGEKNTEAVKRCTKWLELPENRGKQQGTLDARFTQTYGLIDYIYHLFGRAGLLDKKIPMKYDVTAKFEEYEYLLIRKVFISYFVDKRLAALEGRPEVQKEGTAKHGSLFFTWMTSFGTDGVTAKKEKAMEDFLVLIKDSAVGKPHHEWRSSLSARLTDLEERCKAARTGRFVTVPEAEAERIIRVIREVLIPAFDSPHREKIDWRGLLFKSVGNIEQYFIENPALLNRERRSMAAESAAGAS